MPFGNGKLKRARTSAPSDGPSKEDLKDRLIVVRKLKEDPEHVSRQYPEAIPGKVEADILDVESGEVHRAVTFYGNLARNFVEAGELNVPLVTRIVFGGDRDKGARWWGLANDDEITDDDFEAAEAAVAAQAPAASRTNGGKARAAASSGAPRGDEPPF